MSLSDKFECVELVQNWGFWRDQGRWSELLGTFHSDGMISVTWFRGRFVDFVEQSRRAAAAAKSQSKHLIGFPSLSISGNRALAETNIAILGRQELDGILVDSTAHARFLDRIERRDGAWRISERIAIYEKDALVPVIPNPAFNELMKAVDFSVYPQACRFLAYRLVRMGRSLASPIYCDGTPEARDIYRISADWLSAGPAEH